MKSKNCSWGPDQFKSCAVYGHYDFVRKKNQNYFRLKKSENMFVELAFFHLYISKKMLTEITTSISEKNWKFFIDKIYNGKFFIY